MMPEAAGCPPAPSQLQFLRKELMELLIYNFFHEKLLSRKKVMELLVYKIFREKLQLQQSIRRGDRLLVLTQLAASGWV